MCLVQSIRIEAYNYNLPEEKIAKFPLLERDSSKLLIKNAEGISQGRFGDLAEYLDAGSMLVFNNTRVIRARILFQKETGSLIEIFCLEPCFPVDYNVSFAQFETCSWYCLLGNSKRWKSGVLSKTVSLPSLNKTVELTVEKESQPDDRSVIRFRWNDSSVSFSDILEAVGELPIPPYLNRKATFGDQMSYQTVYSKVKGSVAAPTAGLHFTPSVFETLNVKNVERLELTLHVGAGTFKPVKTETIGEHTMHAEWFSVSRTGIEKLLLHPGSIVAVGTTAVRTLESLYFIGCRLAENFDLNPEKIHLGQWDVYESRIELPVAESLQAILHYLNHHRIDELTAHTQIMIVPGYKFRLVDALVTNFHQPQSTLLLLVSAFLGGDWRSVYDYALSNEFRFLSYGDSSLLFRAGTSRKELCASKPSD